MRLFKRQSLPQHRRASTSSSRPELGLLSLCLFLLFYLPCLFPQKATADAVIINFPAALAGETSTGFGSSSGDSLSGNLVRVGAFNTDPTSLMAGVALLTNSSDILTSLNTRFTQYTSFAFSSDYLDPSTAVFPATDDSGLPLEAQPAIGTSLQGKDIYLLFYNAATANLATEVAIFRMKQALLSDDPDFSLGKFNTLASASDGQRTAGFNLSATETDLLLGFYNSQTDTFFTGKLSGGTSQITSPLTETNASGAVSTYQITANNGADRFFATTNTASADLTLTNLPAGFSIATNTGVITAGTNAAANTYSIRLVASNSLTASVATNTLIWTLQASSLSFTTTTNLISAVAGVEISPFTFVSTGTSPTYTADGNLRGLTLSTNGMLSGIPNSVGTNNVSITSSAGGQNGNTPFSLAVAAPTISVPAGELTGGQIVHTAGTARSVTLSKTDGFTDLTGEVSPTTSGITFNGTDLVIAADAAPQLAVSADPVLTLTASRRVDGTTISASTTVALKIVAPIPTWQIAANSLEVVLGENFSLQLQTDQSNFLNLMQIRMLDPLPDDLSVTTAGLIRGKIATTITSDRFETRFVADTGLYKGGGRYTSPPITFLPRNTPPVISSSNRILAGVKLHRVTYSLATSNSTHVDSEILGLLPPGITSRKGGRSGNDIILDGFPTAPGIYTNTLVAKNYLRPGSTSNLQETSMELVFRIFDKKTPITQSLNSASLATLRKGVPIDTNTPLRLTADVLADGTYVIANSKSFRPISFDPPETRYEFLPGILLDPMTGILSGTPRASGTFSVNVSFMNVRKIEKRTVTLIVQ